jgi:hypothetical protein
VFELAELHLHAAWAGLVAAAMLLIAFRGGGSSQGWACANATCWRWRQQQHIAALVLSDATRGS